MKGQRLWKSMMLSKQQRRSQVDAEDRITFSKYFARSYSEEEEEARGKGER